MEEELAVVGEYTWLHPLLRALSKNPFKRPWFGWFGTNPSPALISVAQLGCYGDRAHHAKLGERR